MKKIKDTFGLSRVIEPGAAVPATAWKIENSREINAREARVSLEIIHMERDSFQQVCNECGFDEEKIKAKIIDIISRRGKLHNPFTNSGGIFYGRIEAAGKEFLSNSEYKPGDKILCLTTMTSLPMHIESIIDIDYNYGELVVTGYAIVFISSPITRPPEKLALNYTMTAHDESGSFYSIYKLSKKNMRFLIIGRDLISTIIYIAAIRRAVGTEAYFATILDEDSIGTLSEKQVKKTLAGYADSCYIVDVSRPIESCAPIIKGEDALFDLTVTCEDLRGAEIMSVLLTVNKGKMYFTSLKNHYIDSILVAESMGKEMETYALDQYSEDYEVFTMEMLMDIKSKLDEVNRLYEEQSIMAFSAKKQARVISIDKAAKSEDFIYSSPVTAALIDEVLNIADYDCNVIIQGETGVGKEKILGLIHKNSTRKSMPCVKINCATIQENLAESEFFGYEAGAFTGAQSSGKKGYFELADGGILFLDEVGTLSLAMQSKLLRVLQENQFYSVGGTKPININVRVICANNVFLKQLVEQNKFREDLYYRLNICTITVPPLRERREDIPALAGIFLDNYSRRYGVDKELSPEALSRLSAYDWPGNVRELENLIHRAMINIKGHIIEGDDIEKILNESLYDDFVMDLKSTLRSSASLDFNKIIESQEKQLVEYALKKCGSTRKAADFLNMTQPQLMRKKQKYEI